MMVILKLIGYIFAMYGFVTLLIYFGGPFDLLEKFRNLMARLSPQLEKLFSCVACTSTWVGIFISAINYLWINIPFTPFNMVFDGTHLWWLIIPLDSCFTVGVCWLLHELDEYLEKNSVEYED